MRKEFVVHYLKRVAVLGPFAAILILIPPAPLFAKIAGIGAFFVILLVVQLTELTIVVRNANRAANVDATRGPITVRAGSRRHHRFLMQEKAAAADASNRPPTRTS